MTGKVVGQVSKLEPTHTTVVFLCALVLCIFIERAIEFIAKWSDENRYRDVFDKLQKQLLNLGLISFIIFFIEKFSSQSELIHTSLNAFEFTHVILLFIALSFITQAAFLVQHSVVASKKLLLSLRLDSASLLGHYKSVMGNPRSIEARTFLYFPTWTQMLGLCPKLRTDIEYKLIENLFMTHHDFPVSFDFSKYIYYLFQNYLCQLGNVSSFGWALTIIIVLLNYLRLMAFDTSITLCDGSSSGSSHGTDDHTSAGDDHLSTGDDTPVHHVINYFTHRMLNSEAAAETDDTFDCEDYYTVSYGMVCGLCLSVYIASVHVASCNYYDKLIHICLDKIGLDFHEVGRIGYEQCLEHLVEKEEAASKVLDAPALRRAKSLANSQHSKKSVFESDDDDDHRSPPAHQAHPLDRHAKPHLDHMVSAHAIEHAHQEQALFQEMYEKNNLELKEDTHEEILESTRPYIVQSYHFLREAFLGYKDEFEAEHGFMGEVFVGGIPGLYFLCVELCVFFQCFFISFWATQLVPIAFQSHINFYYIILLTIPVFVNFYLVRHIILHAVMLHSALHLNKQVIRTVCKELVDQGECLNRVGDAVRKEMKRLQVSKRHWKSYICYQFEHYDETGDNQLNKKEFRKFLGAHQIYLDVEEFRALWNCIDLDLSGLISWNELFVVVFPDLRHLVKIQLMITEIVKNAAQAEYHSNRLSKPQWIGFLKSKFDEFDADHSNTIDKQEFDVMLRSFNIELDEHNMRMLYNSIDLEDEECGQISWRDFLMLVDPFDLDHQAAAKRFGADGGDVHSDNNNPRSRRKSKHDRSRSEYSEGDSSGGGKRVMDALMRSDSERDHGISNQFYQPPKIQSKKGKGVAVTPLARMSPRHASEADRALFAGNEEFNYNTADEYDWDSHDPNDASGDDVEMVSGQVGSRYFDRSNTDSYDLGLKKLDKEVEITPRGPIYVGATSSSQASKAIPHTSHEEDFYSFNSEFEV